MIRDAKDIKTEVREELRGGKGNTTIQHIFEKDELKGDSRLLAKIVLEPGCSIGLHEHVSEEEVYYILQGKAKVYDSGETKIIGVGDAVLTGNGNNHSIENVGDDTLELFAIVLTY